MKKMLAMILVVMMMVSLIVAPSFAEEKKTFKVGICNYVDDASLNQIVANIQDTLAAIGEANGVTFEIEYDNCNASSDQLQQIIASFIADEVDLMIGVATPVAMKMQNMTADNNIPVIFAAVSDPLSVGLVDTLEAPGANITGTSDYLDTTAVMNLIFAANPEAKTVGLLYDLSQDSSTTAIANAKAYLDEKGVAYIEATGTNGPEIQQAASSLIVDNVDAIFTPSDNTVMAAELSIYTALAEAGIPHYTGADSFALNGAFLGYGVDYANLGVVTAEMAADVLVNGKDPATLAVRTFDNGTATINIETAEAIGLNYDALVEAFTPYCTAIQSIETAEEFQ